MPNTLIPIQTYTLTSTATSVTFSNIPQNYTDLKLVISARTNRAGEVIDYVEIRPNNSSSNMSTKFVYFSNTTVASTTSTSFYGAVDGATATSSIFGSTEAYFSNYTNSSTKSVTLESVSEQNGTYNYGHIVAGLWSGSAPITSLVCYSLNAVSFVAGSTFTLYGISNGVKATGGTVICAGGYAYHTFTSTGSFLPSQQIKGAEVLVIAGGGGSGDFYGAGGGAGGVAYVNSQTFNAGNSYTALIGSGGNGKASGTGARGDSGTNSIFGSFTAIGGGGGGGGGNTDGLSGGSGGGGSGNTKVGGSSTQTSGTNYIGYGYAGGNAGSNNAGGGGGGAGAVGGAGGAGLSFGGNGISTFSTWHSVTGTGVLSGGLYYIAGGGSASNISVGGLGGGGAGGVSGTANTGSGGGGQTSGGTGNGGSGLIIIRYPLT